MKLAFVVQRYGEEVSGGAELHCRRVAERLARRHDVEVFTTTALDYMSWDHHYPSGRSALNGVIVNRFCVDYSRDKRTFDRHSQRIFGKPHTLLDELEWIRLAGPVSSDFLRALSARRVEFDAIFFFTYEYATTYFGLQLVPERAVLIPTAHDSAALQLDIFRTTFHLPRYIAYNTPAEKTLVEQRFVNACVPNAVVGVGVEPPLNAPDPERFRARFGVRGEFVLYVGRVDESKGCGELFELFERYSEQRSDDLKLVLIGRPMMSVPKHSRIVSLGFVDEQTKYDALAASMLMVAPSLYESLSMACQEAWQAGKPVLVYGRCDVLRDQVARSNGGGWVYDGFQSFAAALDEARSNPVELARRGICGQQFVERTYSWESIENQYEDIICAIVNSSGGQRPALFGQNGWRSNPEGV